MASPETQQEGEARERPDWEALRMIALAQAGHFTSSQAASAGFSDQLLARHVGGRLERPLRGIYRMAVFPPTDHEDLVVALLWAGPDAAISHESALQLHGLTDALPGRIHLRAHIGRRTIPEPYVVTPSAPYPEDIQWIGPVRVTTPSRTVLDLAEAEADPDLVAQAIDEGINRGGFRVRDIAAAVVWLVARGTW